MIHGSLFSGIGGFDLACEIAGIETKWQVEMDKNCQAVLSNHFKEVTIYDDVRTVGKHNLTPVDIITGGFPCQDLSVAGKRAGLAGERSGLWFEFARVIDELEPQWVVIENVPGLLSSNGGRDYTIIIQWLVKRGYGVAWRILDAQHFGVPQRRRRVFIVGSFRDGRASKVLFESEGLCRDTAKSGKAGEEIAGTVTDRVGGSGSGWARWNEEQGLVAFRYKAGAKSGSMGEGLVSPTICEGQPHIGIAKTLSNRNDRIDAEVANFIVDNIAKARHNSDGVIIWEMSHANEAVRESGNKCPTLQQRMGTGGGQVPMVGVRRLTPTECERLQGFPDGWTAGLADSARYRMLGNAVAVPVVEWILKRIFQEVLL